MRTDIFVPDTKARRFERAAKTLAISNSEFYVRAAEKLADEVENAKGLTALANSVINSLGQPSQWTPEISDNAGQIMLAGNDW